jgi:hypothetical protein
MEHLSFTIICKIADGDIKQNEMAVHLAHWKSCHSCQQEVELQRSIVKVLRQTQLINPSTNFTKNVLDTIIPSQKKKWYEWILQNMGNIIAMTSVLAFLGYVFSVTKTVTFQNNKPTKIEPILEFIKIIQDGSHRLGSYLTPKFTVQSTDASQTQVLFFAILAIALLVFIDQIAGHFFRRSKI